MTPSPKAQTTPPKTEPYVLEYLVEGGPTLGEGVHERQSTLRIDERDGTVFEESHRSESDAAGEPIGIFWGRLTEDDLKKYASLVEQVRLAALPAGKGGDFGASTITLKWMKGAAWATRSFSSRDGAILDQLDPLLFALNQLSGSLRTHPLKAIRLSVGFLPDSGDGRFAWTATNIGTEPVCFADPRLLPQDTPDRWAGVRFSEYPPEKPGVTAPPLKWSKLALASAPQPLKADALVVLRPGEKFTAPTVPWQPARRGMRNLAQAVFSDYTGSPSVRDCHRIRGAAFSQGFEITP